MQDDHCVERILSLTNPALPMTVNQVRAKNDASIVKFEALRGIDASDLFNAASIVCPKRFFRNSGLQSTFPGLCIPRTAKVPDYDIFGQAAVRLRI